MCECKATEIVLAIIILVFGIWNSTISWLPSKTVIIIAAVILLVHGIGCKDLSCKSNATPMKTRSKVKKKKRR